MSEGAIRVVLLAREGEARDRLEGALQSEGIELVAKVDPAAADAAGIVASSPQAIVVALEPAIEGDIERLDDVLSRPDLVVLFEEAELAARRTGWDAARWQRHLSAKLHRHEDVLPPGTEQDIDLIPSPGGLPEHAQMPDLELAIHAFADEAQQHADEVAHDRTFDGIEAQEASDGSPFDPVAFESDGGEIAIDAGDLAGFGLEGLSLVVDSTDEGPSVSPADAKTSATGPGTSEDVKPDAPGLALVEGDASVQPSARVSSPESNVALEDRISGLSLADPDSYGFGRLRGAVLVEAGLGGPDAVRQLLSAIPLGFPRPILIRMQLDSGRNKRLAKQMERVTSLGVEVAGKDEVAVAGKVYFLPLGIGLASDKARILFVDEAEAGALADVLPADDSAILLLSGATSQLAEALAAPAWSGALVAGQSPDESYDPSAAKMLAARGGVLARAVALADMLVQRWLPSGRSSLTLSNEEPSA